MKRVLTLSILILSTIPSLNAMDIEIKREFTIAQVMLDLQREENTEEESDSLYREDINASTTNRPATRGRK